MNRKVFLSFIFVAALGNLSSPAVAAEMEIIDKSFGVKGDGTSNDRAALQAAIDASVGQTLIITGNSRIDDKGLTIRSNSHIRFAPGASLKLLPHSTPNYQMMRIWDVQHVEIDNATLDGANELSSAPHDSKSNGYGMGISIAGASDVRLIDPVTKNCWGDGIYIANSYRTKITISENITVLNHHADGCRRQGASIISGRNIRFENPHWENINGTLPSAGLDIEPNSNNDILENIVIDHPTTAHCKIGILVWLSRIAGPRPISIGIQINQHKDIGSEQASYSVSGLDTSHGKVTGYITSTSPTWISKNANPFLNKNYDLSGPNIVITGKKIIQE
ncbi:hypothetical protein BPS26883_06238 [Burkholderia pseudomultivorans]|uniref:Right handed beta helix domain-containing protein n=2 Tax=Burkholderia pseudomultivorans TaxID=1207504 RepID=A0A6P2R8B6_9BURK|nr:hypothetical protein BPS26883_06238 [Burkholderia pseudomultivorans]